jgi:hypothetical protein
MKQGVDSIHPAPQALRKSEIHAENLKASRLRALTLNSFPKSFSKAREF